MSGCGMLSLGEEIEHWPYRRISISTMRSAYMPLCDFFVRPRSRSICWVLRSKVKGFIFVFTPTHKFIKSCLLSNPHGLVTKKADWDTIFPIRFPISCTAVSSTCWRFPRLLPNERYTMTSEDEHCIAIGSKLVSLLQSLFVAFHD